MDEGSVDVGNYAVAHETKNKSNLIITTPIPQKGANVMEQKRITKNGIEIYSYRNPALHGFYISLYLRAGSMHEEHQGITHFLEHISIRNVNAVMDGRLYATLDKCGIEFNATTYNEMVQFFVSGATANFAIAADILTRVFSPIILSSSEIATERGRIKAEIREGDDATSLSTFAGSIVHEGTKLANMITGTIGSVNKINRQLLEDYRRSVMTPENMFFYLTGNFSDEDLATLEANIEKYKLDSGRKNENIAPVCQNFGRRGGRVHIKNADFTMLRFSFDMDMTKMTLAESDLLYDMLFSGNNSLFFIEMSEKRGLCYDIAGYIERYLNIGTITISFEVRPGLVYEAAETVISLLRDFKSRLANEDEMMKAGYVTNCGLLYDSPSELNFAFAYDNRIMNESYKDISDRSARYASVTPERVREVAASIFCYNNLTLAMKGNKKKIDTARLEEIIKKL